VTQVEADEKLEKRLFWMIVPALCIDYIFYYVGVSFCDLEEN